MNNSDKLNEVITAFINCDDFLVGRQIVEQYALILLTDDVFDYIKQLMAYYEKDEEIHHRLKLKLNDLTQCVEYGYNLAFAKLFLEYYADEVPDKLAQKIAGARTEKELTAFIEAHPEWINVFETAVIGNKLLNYLTDEITTVNSQTEGNYRIQLCKTALQLCDRRIDPETFIAIAGELANSLTQILGDTSIKSVEEAIKLYKEILQFYKKNGNKILEATCSHNLGSALAILPSSKNNSNLSEALNYFEAALTVRDRNHFDMDWAQTMLAMGVTLLKWKGKGNDKQIEKAISYLDNSIEVYKPQNAKSEWIRAINSMADAFMMRKGGTKSANMRKAISLLKNITEEVTLTNDYDLLVELQLKMETAYSFLAMENAQTNNDKEENIVPAFGDQEWVLAKRHELPAMMMEEWIPKGSVFALWDELITITKQRNAEDMPFKSFLAAKQRNVKSSIVNGELTWKIHSETEHEMTYEWSLFNDFATENQFELVRVLRGDQALYTVHYACRLEIFEKSQHDNWLARLKKASLTYDKVPRFEEAKCIYLSSAEASNFLNNLENRPSPKDAKNPESFFRKTFYKMNRLEYPVLWASASTTCGLFLSRLPCFEGDIIELAIRYFRRSLEVFKQNNYPEMWADNMQNIARCFINRTTGDKEKNVSEAIFGLEQAIQVFARLHLDNEWVEGLREIRKIHFYQIQGKDVQSLLSTEKSYKKILKKISIGTQPIAWAEKMVTLGDLYFALSSKTLRGNYFKKAKDVYSMVVTEFTSNRIYKSSGRENSLSYLLHAADQLVVMDRDVVMPKIPARFDIRKIYGEILYLRPLKSSGGLLVPNQFTNHKSFKIKFEHFPTLMTIESVFIHALGEHLSFSGFGGRPDGLGAGRGFLAGGEGWEELVSLLMDRSDIIALIPHNSPGVKWEIQTIIDKKILNKCLVIMPPASPQFDVESMWQEAKIIMSELDLHLPDYDRRGLIVRFNANKEIEESIPFKAVWENTLFTRIKPLL